MSSNVVLHIGLHKTATRYLQRAVFSRLDSDRYYFNPPALMEALRSVYREPCNETRSHFLNAAKRALEQANGRTVVVSDPGISGDMYDHHEDYSRNLKMVRSAFPNAVIIYYVRHPADWLHSAYRQSLVKGRSAPIEFFLNFRDGEFRSRTSRHVAGIRNLEALGLRFLEIYEAYANAFGPERVYLFRQEDLRTREQIVRQRLAEALGTESLPPPPERVSANRAFSALALHLFFPGIRRFPRIPADDDGAPPRHLAWRLTHPLRTLRTLFVRHVFDRLIYRDWDLLAPHGMREKIDAHYEREYRALAAISAVVLDEGPGAGARDEGRRIVANIEATEGE